MKFNHNIKPKQATPDDLWKVGLLKKAGFLFGSVRFKCRDPFDEDWLIRRADWESIVGSELGGFCYLNSDYSQEEFQCYFLQHGETLYNFIIPWKDDVFDIVVGATKLMCRIPVHLIENKNKRVELFEAFKRLLR